MSTKTLERVREFISHYNEMYKVFHSEADWEVKYELLLGIAKEIRELNMGVEYCDYDESYQADATNCFKAYQAKAQQYVLAYGRDEFANCSNDL